MKANQDPDELLAFTVATVWREERVSCPHPDILRAHLADALAPGAAAFLKFHLEESECPYCGAVVEELRATAVKGAETALGDLREKLMRSTVAALRRVSRA